MITQENHEISVIIFIVLAIIQAVSLLYVKYKCASRIKQLEYKQSSSIEQEGFIPLSLGIDIFKDSFQFFNSSEYFNFCMQCCDQKAEPVPNYIYALFMYVKNKDLKLHKKCTSTCLKTEYKYIDIRHINFDEFCKIKNWNSEYSIYRDSFISISNISVCLKELKIFINHQTSLNQESAKYLLTKQLVLKED